MSQRPSYVPGSIDFTNTIGATFIGVIVSTFVAGAVFNQAFTYYRNFPKDIGVFRWSVFFITILNLVHSGCIIAAQYFWTITGWGDIQAINISTTEYPVSFLLTGLVAAIVQTCYAYRIYIVSNHQWPLPTLITLLTLMQLGASFYCTIMAAKAGLQSEFLPYFQAAYVWLYGEAAADLIITVSLIYYLQSVRDSTNFRSTRSLANRLSVLTFETNALTLISCVASAIALQVRKDGWGPAINFLSVKLYALSLMITLNARARLSASNSQGSMGSNTLNRYGYELNKTQPDIANQVHVQKEAVSIAYRRDQEEKKRGFDDDDLVAHPYTVNTDGSA